MKPGILLTRPWYWLPAIASACAGLLSASTGRSTFRWDHFFVTVLIIGPGASAFAEAINDLSDLEFDAKGTRKICLGIPLAGGSGALLEGLTRRQAELVAMLCALLGLGLSIKIGLSATVLYVAILLVAIAYSVPPLRLKRRGLLGPVAQTIGYGPLAFHLGVCVAGLSATLHSMAISFLIGLWIGIVGLTADLLDHDDDKAAGIMTLPVMAGRTNSILLIAVGGAALLSIMIIFQRHPSAAQLLWVNILCGAFSYYIILLWRSRRTHTQPKAHLMAIVMETGFPLLAAFM